MMHISCDICGKVIRPGQDLHFVLKVELFASGLNAPRLQVTYPDTRQPIVNGTIGTNDLQDGGVTGTDIASHTVTAANIDSSFDHAYVGTSLTMTPPTSSSANARNAPARSFVKTPV